MAILSGAILTKDPNMQRLIDMVGRVAPTRASITIAGARGTGKSLLSEYIHARSLRAGKPLISLNLAATPTQGSSSATISEFRGNLQQARGSTLVLRNVDALPLCLQDELYQEIFGGSDRDIRLIATTTKDLRELVRTHKFSDQLHYRLSVISLYIPPLRARTDDILYLARLFIDLAVYRNGLRGKYLNDEALAKLKKWDWPGNIPELEAVIERSALLAKTDEVGASDILLNEGASAEIDRSFRAGMTISQAEKKLILTTLEYTGQNKTQAANMLGISTKTLRSKLQEYQGGRREQFV